MQEALQIAKDQVESGAQVLDIVNNIYFKSSTLNKNKVQLSFRIWTKGCWMESAQ